MLLQLNAKLYKYSKQLCSIILSVLIIEFLIHTSRRSRKKRDIPLLDQADTDFFKEFLHCPFPFRKQIRSLTKTMSGSRCHSVTRPLSGLVKTTEPQSVQRCLHDCSVSSQVCQHSLSQPSVTLFKEQMWCCRSSMIQK